MLKRRNVHVINKQNLLTFNERDIVEDYKAGLSVAQMVKKYNSSHSVLRKILNEWGIEVINQQNRLRFNANIFDNIDTEEKAYWLGFIYADGYIATIKEKGKKEYNFELSLCLQDKSHLDKFNKFMEHEDENHVKVDSYRARWIISNKHLWETLNSYGCTPRKSLTLKFPDKSIFKSKDLIRHFIRGYFDGDGCISHIDKTQEKPLISLLGTKEILEPIQKMIFSDNVKLTLNDKNNSMTLVMSRSCVKAIFLLYILYYKSSIYLDRKYQKFLFYKDCRFKAKALKLLEEKIGEGWDVNPELIADLNDLQQCNA